jgi:protein-S-isoprenylcysteine O-methyltransferase Ste14
MIVGIIIWSGKPWLLLCLVILIPMQIVRSQKESQVLAEKFGVAYQEYKRRTWF